MSQAIAHIRPTRKTRARLSKVASARDTIAGFGHDTDIAGLTFGQFSLLDLIDATLEITGPADVAVSTWSGGSTTSRPPNGSVIAAGSGPFAF